MKKILFFVPFIVFLSLLSAKEISSFSHFKEEKSFVEKERSQFMYFSTGMNPFPTFSIGYRKLYGSFGSDLSVSTSFLPLGTYGKIPSIPFPGINYKQLFFKGEEWKGLAAGSSAFYLGLETGVYPLGGPAVNVGGLLGWQFRREKRWDFFQIGVNPFLYAAKEFYVTPLASISYAFLF